jgi:hypothetical protein
MVLDNGSHRLTKRRIELQNVTALVEVLRPLPSGIVSFDGCDGAGKTTLAQKISDALGHDVVDLDKHLVRDTGEFVNAIRLAELVKDIDGALTRSRVVLLSGVCMQQVLAAVNRSAAVSVYVQRNTSAGLPGDIDFIGVESGVEASDDVVSYFNELELEIYA